MPTYDFDGRSREAAEALIIEALGVAYRGKSIPDGLITYLKSPEKPGAVCALFFSGRSGSFFAQSFFDHEKHPQIITVPPAALAWVDRIVMPEDIARFNSGVLPPGPLLTEWVEWIIKSFASIYTRDPNQSGLDRLCAPEAEYRKLVHAQIMLTPPGKMNYEALLKILFIAYRVSRGGEIAYSEPLVFLWQAHSPSAQRKRWLKQKIANWLHLTVGRFPEKTLDSHLVHHAFETVSPPLHTLFRRLFFEHLARDMELADYPPDGREASVRFEDLHQHTVPTLKSICAWLGVPFIPALGNNDFTLQVRGTKVTGCRKLTPEEFETKMLNRYDRLRIRMMMQQEYRHWGDDAYCKPTLEASIEEYQKDEIVRNIPFSPQAILAQMSGGASEVLAEEAQLLEDLYAGEIGRREKIIHMIPLLYSPDTN